MTTTINRPAWATRHEGTEEGQPGWFERDLLETFNVEGIGNEIDTLADDGDQASVILVLDPSDDGSPRAEVSGHVELVFKWPESMRALASALHRAANEWARVNNEADARAFMAATERLGLPQGLTERQIDGRDMFSLTDLLRFVDQHGLDRESLDAIMSAVREASAS